MKQTTTVSFDQAFAAIPVGSRKLPAQRYCGSGDFAVVDQGQKLVAGYTDNNDLVLQSSAFDPWIVFGDHTRIVKFIEFPFVVGADGVRLFKARSGFDHLYLYYFLRSAELPNDGYGRHSKHLAELQVPLLSLDAQRHIAIHLKTQLAAVDDARLAAEAQLQEATRLIHSIIRESAEHPDSDFATLGDVLEEVKQGIGPSWSQLPVLGVTRDGLAPAKEAVGKNPERYKPVVPGTVFYNPMRIMIGSIAMADEGDAPGITSPDYVVLRGRPGKVDSRWFYHWLRAPEGEYCIASLARGAVRERMLFNRLAEGEIELPPYPVQVQASKALAEVRKMRAAIEAQLRDIEMMPARLLSQAFDEYDA